jgi:TonB family protein
MTRPSGSFASTAVLATALCIQGGSRSPALPHSIPRMDALSSLAIQDSIPKATEPCSPEEAKWWQDVREAGHQLAAAARRKHQAVTDARRKRGVGDDENDALTQNEREGYDTQIKKAREEYLRLLGEGTEKSYRVPLGDRKGPLILYSGRLWYTKEARAMRIAGEVRLIVVFGANGAVGAVKTAKGLGYGLDEKAIEAVREMVFLPAVNSGRLITVSKYIDVAFNLS